MARGRALFFLHKQPYPPIDSTKFRVYRSVIEQLSDFQRDFFIVTWESANVESQRGLERLGNVQCHALPRWRLLFNILKRALSVRPWQTEMLFEPKIERRFHALLEDADVVYVHTLRLGRYLERLPERLRRKIILDMNDSFARHYLRSWRYYPFAQRLLVLLEGLKFKRYERKMVALFEHVTIIGHDDSSFVTASNRTQNQPVVLYPPVPVRQAIVTQRPLDGMVNLYFLGNLRYYPNREGIEWFLRTIWPLLHAQIPQTRLYIIGNVESRLYRRYRSREGIEWTGYCSDDDLEALLERMHVFVSPVRIGSGIQAKIIEALLTVKPVLAAAEATSWVRHFPDIAGLFRVRTTNPSAWVEAMREILAGYDQVCSEMCSERMRTFLVRTFGIDRAAEQYRAIAERIATSTPRDKQVRGNAH